MFELTAVQPGDELTLSDADAATPDDLPSGSSTARTTEDMLNARVRELVPQKVWQRRYARIVAFEQLLVDSGELVLDAHRTVVLGANG